MPSLVAGDHAADPSEVRVPVARRDTPDVAVRHARRTLLNRCVHQKLVWVRFGPRIEAVGDQVVHCTFHCTHVDAASEAQVGIQQIAVPVLFSGPSAEPLSPGRRTVAVLVTNEPVERDGVARQRLLGDHVANEDYEQFIGDPLCGLPELLELVPPLFRPQVREEVGRLPCLLERDQEIQIARYRRLDRQDHRAVVRQRRRPIDEVSMRHGV